MPKPKKLTTLSTEDKQKFANSLADAIKHNDSTRIKGIFTDLFTLVDHKNISSNINAIINHTTGGGYTPLQLAMMNQDPDAVSEFFTNIPQNVNIKLALELAINQQKISPIVLERFKDHSSTIGSKYTDLVDDLTKSNNLNHLDEAIAKAVEDSKLDEHLNFKPAKGYPAFSTILKDSSDPAIKELARILEDSPNNITTLRRLATWATQHNMPKTKQKIDNILEDMLNEQETQKQQSDNSTIPLTAHNLALHNELYVKLDKEVIESLLTVQAGTEDVDTTKDKKVLYNAAASALTNGKTDIFKLIVQSYPDLLNFTPDRKTKTLLNLAKEIAQGYESATERSDDTTSSRLESSVSTLKRSLSTSTTSSLPRQQSNLATLLDEFAAVIPTISAVELDMTSPRNNQQSDIDSTMLPGMVNKELNDSQPVPKPKGSSSIIGTSPGNSEQNLSTQEERSSSPSMFSPTSSAVGLAINTRKGLQHRAFDPDSTGRQSPPLKPEKDNPLSPISEHKHNKRQPKNR